MSGFQHKVLAARQNLRYTTTMALRRKVLLALLILPVVAVFAMIVFPGLVTQFVFLLFGVPVLVLNAWEFFLSEAASPFFDLSQKKAGQAGGEGSAMKIKWSTALIIVASVLVLLMLAYAGAKSVVDEVPYSLALSTFLMQLVRKTWQIVSNPLVFTALLILLFAVIAGPQILKAVKKTGESESVPFPGIFQKPLQSPFAEVVSQSEDNESILAMERMIGEGIDIKAVQLMLEVDGIDISRPYMLSKVKTLGIHSEGLPAGANPVQKEAYFQGVLEGLYGYLFPLFCTIGTSNEEKTARFTLKPGVRDRLMLRLNQGNLPPEVVSV